MVNKKSSLVNGKSSIVNDSTQTHFESLFPVDSRFAEIEKVLEFVKAGNSCQVISLLGGGKSNVLNLLTYNKKLRTRHLGENEKWLHFVLSDFSEMRNRSMSDVIKFLFLGIVDSLRERELESEEQTISEFFKDALSANDELVLFQGLKRAIDYLAIEKELTVVFLFDRLEAYIPFVTPVFFTNLRVLRNLAKFRFSAVFSLTRPLDQLVETSLLSDFHDFVSGNTVFVQLFDKPGFEFRLSYMEKVHGKKLSEMKIDAMLKLTGGHPQLTRLATEALLEQEKPGNLEALFLQQRRIQRVLEDIWLFLTPAEQHYLASREKRLASSYEMDSSFLEHVGLFKDDKIQVPLFEIFVQQKLNNLTIEQLNNEKLLFDPETNEIRKGEQVFSNKLTALEFRLLQFLLKNENKILSREEIINAVWMDMKTTEGVTDQALDQLIFRLRKKIEDDANNPSLLQTVKGRGVRFSQETIESGL